MSESQIVPQKTRGRTGARAKTLRPVAGYPVLCSPREAELPALLNWLDDGNRDGRRGALAAEYPTALAPSQADNHVIIRANGRLASHAYSRVIEVVAGGVTLQLGMIGLVYTDPAFRRRGFAESCIEACVQRLVEQGVSLCVLWSDLLSYYSRLGFDAGGRETHYVVNRRDCAGARRRLPGDFEAGSPLDSDWPQLESLYAGKSCRAKRNPGDLQRLARAPGCDLVVSRSAGEITAYAALGRGDDFQGVVHEWAGDDGGVAKCLEALLEGREAIAWMTGPDREGLGETLSACGAAAAVRRFALLRILDPEGLFSTISAGFEGCRDVSLRWSAHNPEGDPTVSPALTLEIAAASIPLRHSEALEFLFGERIPRVVRERAPRLAGTKFSGARPFPLFVGGFDSI